MSERGDMEGGPRGRREDSAITEAESRLAASVSGGERAGILCELAELYWGSGRPEAALAALGAAADLLGPAGPSRDLAECQFNLAVGCQQLERYGEGAELAAAAARIFGILDLPRQKGAALRLQGAMLLDAGRVREAAAPLQEAREVFLDIHRADLAAECDYMLAEMHLAAPEEPALKEALARFNAARAGFAQSGRPVDAADSDRRAAGVLWDLGRREESLGRLDAAALIFEGAGMAGVAAGCRETMSHGLSALGRESDALAEVLRAQSLLPPGAPGSAARLSLQASHCLRRLGRYDEALARIAEARAGFDAAGEIRELVVCDSYEANILDTLGDHAGSLTLLRRALAGFELHGSAVDAANCRKSLASALASLGRDDEALMHLTMALQTLRALGEPAQAASCWLALAHLLRRTGEFPQAAACLVEAWRFYERRGSAEDVATFNDSAGNLMHDLGRFREALGLHASARAFFARSDLGVDLAVCDYCIGSVLDHLGRRRAAERAFRRSRDGFAEAGKAVDAAWCYVALASVVAPGRPREARRLFDEGIRVLAAAQLAPPALDWARIQEARVLAAEGRALQALDLFDQVDFGSDRAGHYPRAEALELKSTILWSLGRRADAHAAAEEARREFRRAGLGDRAV